MGYDEATASHFAVLLGDTPLSDRAGNYIVMDGGKQLAILPPLAFFQEPD